MTTRLTFLLLLTLLPTLTSAADITLSPDSPTTLQQTIDALPKDNPAWTRILLKPGTYTQQLTVSRPKVALIGLGASPSDVRITYNLSAKSPKPAATSPSDTVGTTGSSSTFIKSPDFFASNVTFANSTPDNTAQAVAIKTQSDRCVFYNCSFEGFQDTLYPTAGRCYFKSCYITGDTDFIFGNATAVFDACTINSSDASYVTAANTTPTTKHGFVFLDCTLTASPNVKPNSTYLGRPWQWDRGSNASVTLIRCKLGPHINPKGWHPWDDKRNTTPAQTTRYAEHASTTPDGHPTDTSDRVPWSKQLTNEEAAAYTVESILAGPDNWNPQPLIQSLTQPAK